MIKPTKTINLAEVIEELVDERGLDRSTLSTIVCDGLIAAYERKYPGVVFRADYNPKSGDVVIMSERTVVPTVTDPDFEISLKKAHAIDKKLQENETVWTPFEGPIGRIEILRARQVIAGQIRKIESLAVFNQFKDLRGEVVHGTIHKCEHGGAVVKIDDTLAFLPKTAFIPGDKCTVGFTIRALLKEVLEEPRHDHQLILDRSSEEFLTRLFELEIPEIFEKLVEIKKIVRAAGYKTKIVVASNDPNIDPVGTCVGVGGSRIKPILKEIGGEKIDVIPWTESREALIRNALKPAQVDRVEILDGDRAAKVWLSEDQRALAIGKMGQNITLASRLVGLDLQLVQKEKQSSVRDALEEQMADMVREHKEESAKNAERDDVE